MNVCTAIIEPIVKINDQKHEWMNKKDVRIMTMAYIFNNKAVKFEQKKSKVYGHWIKMYRFFLVWYKKKLIIFF